MKVRAHPLMVAVALGLIGPQALAEDDERAPGDRVRCPGCTCDGQTTSPAACDDDAVAVTGLALDGGVDADLDVAVDALWADLRDLV